MWCSSTVPGSGGVLAPSRLRASPMRSDVRGWLRRYGNAPLSFRREDWSSFSNIAAMPPGEKPAPESSEKPMRSASRSMSREKFSWP